MNEDKMTVYKMIADKMTLCLVTIDKMTMPCDYRQNDYAM